MIKQILAFFAGTKATAPEAQVASNPQSDALMRAIAEQSKSDPLIGAKIGSKELFQILIRGLKTDKGVHVESLVVALGALAGYSCQASVRALAKSKNIAETSVFTIIGTKDGQKYFYGDALNKPLSEDKYSVLSLAGGGAKAAGCNSFLDVNEVFIHVTQTVGKAEFGLVRYGKSFKASDTPLGFVKGLWPVLLPTIQKFCPNPEHWPILVAITIQDTIIWAKEVIDPGEALRLTMEAAVPMSKVNL